IVKGAKADANFAAKHCAAYSQNQVFIAVSAVMTGLVAAGKLSDNYEEAKKTVDNAVDDVVISILKAALTDPDSPLYPLASALPQNMQDAILKDAIDT